MPKATGRRLNTPPVPAHRNAGSAPRLPAGMKPKRRPKNSSSKLMIVSGIVTILIIVPAIAIVVHSARKGKTQNPPAATSTVEAKTQTVSSPVPTAGPASSERSPEADSSTEVEAPEVREMVSRLAVQISQKSGYEFGPEFIELIRGRSHEYASAKALLAARQYRREINKSFHDEGLHPFIGYVLAMSRSKFDPSSSDKGVGVWQIPLGVARSQGYLGSTESAAKLRVPEVSAQIAASYTRQLLSAFEPEDFMYAIGCFGMSLQEAGKLQARLVTVMPDAKNRRDIKRVIQAGVLSDEQVDNIARFFAAGIVGENPQKFGLADSQPFSSLY